MTSRRSFLKTLGVASGVALTSPQSFGFDSKTTSGAQVRFGLISDVHHLQWKNRQEVERIKVFIDESIKRNPDFIIQCGDFCKPDGAEPLIKEWNRFPGKKYHVLGNHDMDGSDKATIMKVWGMEKPYYSFDEDGFHFIVMDRNCIKKDDGTYMDYAKGNYYRYPSAAISHANPEQVEWLREDLAKTNKPTVIFMHQPVFLSDSAEVRNARGILAAFDEANHNTRKAGKSPKVIAVFMGHDHDDLYGERNGVHYFIVNSASYAYTSGAYFYKEPLFGFVTLDPSGTLSIEGRNSSYVSGVPDKVISQVFPQISTRKVFLSS